MIPGVGLYIDGVIKEGDKVVRKIRRVKGHSFVKQYAQLLLLDFCATSPYVRNTNNALEYPVGTTGSTFMNRRFGCDAASGEDRTGLVIGTGNTAVTVSDYKLATKISNGITSGTLQYGAVAVGAPTTDLTSNYFVITRVFTNGSGSPVTIKEIGLIAYNTSYSNVLNNVYLIARDILPSEIPLNNGQNVTINYTIKATI